MKDASSIVFYERCLVNRPGTYETTYITRRGAANFEKNYMVEDSNQFGFGIQISLQKFNWFWKLFYDSFCLLVQTVTYGRTQKIH